MCDFALGKHQVNTENSIQLNQAMKEYATLTHAHTSAICPLPQLVMWVVRQTHPFLMLQFPTQSQITSL